MDTFSPEVVRMPPPLLLVPSLFLPCAFQLLGERKRVSAIGSPFCLFIHGFSI